MSSESAPDFPSGACWTRSMTVAGVPAGELAQLHGVGPKALRIVQAALEAEGQSLA